MKLLRRIGFLCFLVQWSVHIIESASYFQSTVGGYVFTIPGFNDEERRTQAVAQTWCNRNQSKLLEITSESIQRSVVSFCNGAISQNQMTGNDVITNGMRSALTLTWLNGGPLRSSIPVKGQEPGLSHSHGYLNSSRSGFEFYVDAPTAKRGYICEGSSFCSNGFTLNGRCFKSNFETLSWFDARNRCLTGGGDIASFDFILDGTGFITLNASGWISPSTYWIGLQRMKWTWQGSNSDVRYSQWSEGHPDYDKNPNNDCLCLLPNTAIYDWKWAECDCSLKYQFVCISETGSTTTSSSAISSSTTLSSATSSSTTRSTVNEIPSTSSTAEVRTLPSLNLPTSTSSVNNSEISFTTVLTSSTSVNSSASGGTHTDADNSLAIGLGVGIGGGVLLIAIIIVVIVVTVRRKGCPRKPERQPASYVPPDVTSGGSESTYATVVKNPQYDDATLDVNAIPPPPEYADLRIVRGSRHPKEVEKKRRSFV